VCRLGLGWDLDMYRGDNLPTWHHVLYVPSNSRLHHSVFRSSYLISFAILLHCALHVQISSISVVTCEHRLRPVARNRPDTPPKQSPCSYLDCGCPVTHNHETTKERRPEEPYDWSTLTEVPISVAGHLVQFRIGARNAIVHTDLILYQ
jgi:hypothetical protein